MKGRVGDPNAIPPLYIVDGVEVKLSKDEKGNQVSPLSIIPQDEIETIEVLKGADAAKLYGEKGGKNGVILIKTKNKETIKN